MMMPARKRTRAQSRADRIKAERALNDAYVAERNEPPFWVMCWWAWISPPPVCALTELVALPSASISTTMSAKTRDFHGFNTIGHHGRPRSETCHPSQRCHPAR
jgi:hypothetical protein